VPLLACLLGLLSLPWWPPAWRTGLGLGWGAAWLLTFLLDLAARHREDRARSRGRSPELLGDLALGFLARLTLLLAGGIAGSLSGAWAPAPFLLSFLPAALLGEAWLLRRALRRSGPRGTDRIGPSPRPPAS